MIPGVVAAQAASAQATVPGPAGPQMPDPSQMSGIPLPTTELAVGTLTVRVIRGSLSNPLPGLRVEIVGDTQASAATNENGRAEFTRLRPGSRVTARTTVDGQTLESQQIEVPGSGGVRVMLVATDPAAAKRAEEDRRLAQGPAQRGAVVLGDQSRFVFELGDQGLNVFNIVQILNTARVPVDPIAPVTFALPEGAEQAALLEGSSPLATAAGQRVDVRGPFPPGVTLVQFAYTMPYSGDAVTIRQVLPAQLTQLTVVAQKNGETRLSSPQLREQREMTSEGQTYILARGPALAAGATAEFQFAGLPHAATWPRDLALALAAGILLGGLVVVLRKRGPASAGAQRSRLAGERERLFDELTTLDEDHRLGRISPAAFAARRQQIMSTLESLYAALEEDAA
jgi:hypothetical protein